MRWLSHDDESESSVTLLDGSADSLGDSEFYLAVEVFERFLRRVEGCDVDEAGDLTSRAWTCRTSLKPLFWERSHEFYYTVCRSFDADIASEWIQSKLKLRLKSIPARPIPPPPRL